MCGALNIHKRALHFHKRALFEWIYGVATNSRLLQIVGLFCKRALQKSPLRELDMYLFEFACRALPRDVNIRRDIKSDIVYVPKETYICGSVDGDLYRLKDAWERDLCARKIYTENMYVKRDLTKRDLHARKIYTQKETLKKDLCARKAICKRDVLLLPSSNLIN